MFVLFTSPVLAERADRDKPVNIESDKATVDDVKQISVFEGHVTLTQGTLVIHSDRMIVRQDADGFHYSTAYGNPADFRQKREGVDEYVTGYADRIEYNGKIDKLELFNRAHMKRGNDDVRGNYISYDAATEFFQVTGGGKVASTGNNPEGRVRVVIQPKNKNKAASPQQPNPVSLQPAPIIENPRPD